MDSSTQWPSPTRCRSPVADRGARQVWPCDATLAMACPMSQELRGLLPEFVVELEAALRAAGHLQLAGELQGAKLERWTFDPSCDAAYLYVSAGRDLNVVERNVIGGKHGETIPVKHRYSVNIDTDNFGCLCGIEVLDGQELAKELGGTMAPQ